MSWCRGQSGTCETCGALYISGDWQRCPSPKYTRRGKPAKSVPSVAMPCIHLGEQIREELIKCKTCRGNVRVKFPVYQCDVFGECLSTYRGEHELAKCDGCEKRESTPA